MHYDCLVVGAGFAGVTLAERLASELGWRSLIVEKRNHIGGNAFDCHDDHGVLVHTYGPHYFRTNAPRIREYLSQFTDWHTVEYKILSYTDGRYWNFPINLNTFEQFLGRPSTTEEMESWLAARRVPVSEPANSEEVIVSQVGWDLYRKFFEGYTLKQWRRHPRDLDASVCGRIPVRTNRDDRYLREDFQALPAEGYTRLFERMLASVKDLVEVRLNTDYRDILPHVSFKRLVYTGPVDEFFAHEFGHLPYRSLRFEPESFTPKGLRDRLAIVGKPGFWQPAMQVNYPNSEDFTRIVEIKHATGQNCDNTTIVREYPEDFRPGKEPYYPIPAPDATTLYRRYKALADDPATVAARLSTLRSRTSSAPVSFIGRLATYRYYNMDQVTAMALAEFDRISNNQSNCLKNC